MRLAFMTRSRWYGLACAGLEGVMCVELCRNCIASRMFMMTIGQSAGTGMNARMKRREMSYIFGIRETQSNDNKLVGKSAMLRGLHV